MKYKLIETYPGSPQLGEVIDTDSRGLHSLKPNFDYGMFPEYWQPIDKTPIMETSDGHNVFKGDTIWRVSLGWEVSSVDDMNLSKVELIKSFKSLTFATKRAAEEYAHLNKPVYSRKDILNFAKKYSIMEIQYAERILHATYENLISYFITKKDEK